MLENVEACSVRSMAYVSESYTLNYLSVILSSRNSFSSNCSITQYLHYSSTFESFFSVTDRSYTKFSR